MVYEGVDYEGNILKFLLVMGSVLTSLNLYLGTKIFVFFPETNYWAVIITFILLGFSFPFFTYLERLTHAVKVRQVYFLTTLWAGLSFIAMTTFILHDLFNILYYVYSGNNLYTSFIGIVTLLITFILFFIAIYNATKIVVREETLYTEKDIDGFSFVHFSDPHIGALNLKKTLQRIVDKVNEFNPDFVTITGDLLDGSGVVNEEVLSPLNGIKTKKGTYFSTGNHEIYFGLEEACELIDTLNVKILRSETVTFDDYQITGLDNPASESSDVIEGLDEVKNDASTDRFSLLLYHPPSGISQFLETDFDILLSGHTHAGQIYPFKHVVRVFHEYVYGLYKIGKKYVNVTSGAGTWGPPMRLGTRNEIVHIIVKQAEK